MMLPSPLSRPDWLPVRLVLISIIIAGCVVFAGGGTVGDAWRMLAEPITAGPEQGGLERAGATLAMLCLSMLIATGSGLTLAIFLNGFGKGALAVAMVVGRFVALVPIAAVGWAFVGGWMGKLGMPVETLLPSLLMPRGESMELALGRWIWGWAVPVLLVAVPISGEVLNRACAWLHDGGRSEDELGLHARGISAPRIFFHHRLAQWICSLGPQVQALGLMALGYFVVVEQILSVRGWGGWLAEAVLTGDRVQLAGAVHMGGWIAGGWCGIASMFGGWKRVKQLKEGVLQYHQPWFQGLAAITLVVVILAGMWIARDEPMLWWDPISADLWLALKASVLGTLVASGLALLPRGFPLVGLMESFGWAPWLVWAVVAASLTTATDAGMMLVLGVGAGAVGGWHLRQVMRINRLSYEAAIVAGISRRAAWARHVRPIQIQAAVAWFAESFGWLLLSVILVRYLGASLTEETTSGLGQSIASSAVVVLTAPEKALTPGLVSALCALSFQLVGRIIQPRTLL